MHTQEVQRKNMRFAIKAKIRKIKEEKNEMNDIVEKLMNKEVVIKSLVDTSIGTITKIEDNWVTLLVGKNKKEMVINTDYVVSVTPYGCRKNKKNKDKI